MVLRSVAGGVAEGDDEVGREVVLESIATIDDTLELCEYDAKAPTKPPKVNKWHEKFGKGR
jgi:hypothetical protein